MIGLPTDRFRCRGEDAEGACDRRAYCQRFVFRETPDTVPIMDHPCGEDDDFFLPVCDPQKCAATLGAGARTD